MASSFLTCAKPLKSSPIMCSSLSALLQMSCFFYLILGDTNEKGRKFLEENAKKEGVITFSEPQAFGTQYKILNNGTGLFGSIAPKTRCKVGYNLSNIDGVVAYSSFKDREFPDLAVTKNMDGMVMGATKPPLLTSQIIRNLYHIMGDMVEGDMWEIYMPAEVGFDKEKDVQDDKLKGIISPGDVVIFTLELRKLLGEKRRIHDCVLQTRQNCIEEEVELMDRFQGKGAGDLKAEIRRLKSLLQSPEPLKTEDKKVYNDQLKFLRKLAGNAPPEDSAKAEL